MNAYELASGGEHIAQANYSLDNQIRGYLMDMASMLRQQADRIAELEKLVADMIYEKSSGVYDAEPVAWCMQDKDGNFYDCICPEEHARHEGSYTVPLYTTPQTISDDEVIERYRELARKGY